MKGVYFWEREMTHPDYSFPVFGVLRDTIENEKVNLLPNIGI
jgi:hypothetical protein